MQLSLQTGLNTHLLTYDLRPSLGDSWLLFLFRDGCSFHQRQKCGRNICLDGVLYLNHSQGCLPAPHLPDAAKIPTPAAHWRFMNVIAFQSSVFWFHLVFVICFVFWRSRNFFSILFTLSSAYCGISFSLLFLVPFRGSWGHCLRLFFFYSISTANFPVGIPSLPSSAEVLCFYVHSVWNTFSFPFWFILDLWII